MRKSAIIFSLVALFTIFFATFTQAAAAQNPTNNFLVISDIHLDNQSTHIMEMSPVGLNPNNDLDKPTLINLLATIHENIQDSKIAKPKFILFLGDVVGHLRLHKECVLESETAVFKLLKQTFPDTPLLYIFGNNDSFDANYGPFYSRKFQMSPYKVAMIAGWHDGFLSSGFVCGKGIFPCLINKDVTHGYYAAYLAPKLKFLALNSVLFSPPSNGGTQHDATDELLWLKTQLQMAANNGESVLIAMHIPPGRNVYDHSNFLQTEFNTTFLDLINSYKKNIIGILTAHTHAEELKVMQPKDKKIITGVLFTAALSTSHANMPSVKTFYYEQDANKWVLTNYETFHFLTSNHLEKLYDFNNYYCDGIKSKTIFECLNQVSAAKMKLYFSAGNKNYSGKMNSPDDIFIK